MTAQAQPSRDRAREQARARVPQARLDAEAYRKQAVAEARDRIASSREQSSSESERQGRQIELEAKRTRDQDVVQVVAAVRDLVRDSGRTVVSS